MSTTEQPPVEEKPDEQSNQDGENKDRFLEELRSTPGVSEDTAVFIAQNWPKVLGMLVLTLVLVGGFLHFRASSKKTSEAASLLFSNTQSAYSDRFKYSASVPPANIPQEGENPQDEQPDSAAAEAQAAAEKEAAAEVFRVSLSQLEQEHASSVYSDLADLYRAMALLDQNQPDEARKLLKKYDFDSFAKAAAPLQGQGLSSEQLVKELAGLLFAKSFLIGETPQVAEARAWLQKLARGSRVVTGEALLALYRVAVTESEKKEALKLAREIVSSRTGAIASQIRSEFVQLGITL